MLSRENHESGSEYGLGCFHGYRNSEQIQREREMSPAVLAGTKEMWYLAVALIINKLWSSSKCDANYRLCLRTQIHSCIFCEKCYSGDRLGEE